MSIKWLRQLTVGLLLFSVYMLTLGQDAVAVTDSSVSASRNLLQKGLTLFEIEQELARIALEDAALAKRLAETESQIQDAEKASLEAKQHAAKVIRAYYMGDRDALWFLMFSIRSLSDALTTMEYLQMILASDKEALHKHTQNNEALKRLRASLAASQAELQLTKDKYMKERARQTMLQKELNEELSQNKEAERILKEMLTLNQTWQEKGIPLFRTYFKALAEASKDIPELAGGSGSNLIMNGFNYTFQITEQELNDFLRKKNELFHNMTFRFTTDYVIASGKQDNIDVLIKGSYQLAEKNSGVKYVRFRINELHFNGYPLPDTTAADLEKEFDLGIYPQNVARFLQVTQVRIEEGKLSLHLKLAL
ncbi:hypothetical protein RAC89_21465 [Paenibacillus sp. GD4]|uniref:hypothetical protein n=1 Tax=Paenibacillus sp. GD4 TaxID=3068890 RepID=UPI002796473D|nr:hypothetical protein [Paenibacillus sp. GD4]MDQ1912967.1 hypothetical protein [Paenibacillus sp. GD4]